MDYQNAVINMINVNILSRIVVIIDGFWIG
jgi:hypothetical protein